MSSATSYRFTVPPTAEQGSYAGQCSGSGHFGSFTYRSDALSQYNSARAHDGLSPLARMPAGTRYQRIAAKVGKRVTP